MTDSVPLTKDMTPSKKDALGCELHDDSASRLQADPCVYEFRAIAKDGTLGDAVCLRISAAR